MTVAQVQTVAFLSLFVFAESADAIPIQQLSTIDWVREISIMTFELTIFASVYFKELLAERNKVIAKNILEQCQLYEETPNSFTRFKKQIQIMFPPQSSVTKIDENGVDFITSAPGIINRALPSNGS